MPFIIAGVTFLVVYWREIIMTILCVIAPLMALGRFKRRRGKERLRPTVGFVHPDSGGGGGGERVLWVALAALRKQHPELDLLLYTRQYRNDENDDIESSNLQLATLVKKQFNISCDVQPVYLSNELCKYQDPSMYPRLTLVLQSVVGALALFHDVAFRNGCPDIVVDTVGIPFTYPLYYWLCGAKVVTYTHYPTVSTDMIDRVQNRTETYNNTGAVSRSSALTTAKLWYYRAFAKCYRFAGRHAAVVMTNSSWTTGHIKSLWGGEPQLVFPPVNVEHLTKIPLDADQRRPDIVSIGQFRPEKEHLKQIRAFAKAVPSLPESTKLYLVGGARNDGDKERVEACKTLAKELGVESRVVFEVSVPYARIVELLSTSAIGLHAMQDEHFGIVVVEYIAAGCVALAHKSAGPEMDIIVAGESPSVSRAFGELAVDELEYADKLVSLLKLWGNGKDEWKKLQADGRAHAARFTDEGFGTAFLDAMGKALPKMKAN